MHRADRSSQAARLLLSGILFMTSALAALPGPSRACSTFCMRSDGQVVFGKNYDWPVDSGLLIVNQRGVSKSGLSTGTGDPPSWVARHGSVTFNQYGRELPSGGINEAGLVVELLWLDESSYPSPDERPAIGTLQWIQYQLDLHSTVEEVIASDGEVRITPGGAAKTHYLVADRSGQAATIEFLLGKLVAHTGDTLPIPALTNTAYKSALSFANDRLPADGSAAADAVNLPAGRGSLARFARLANGLRTAPGTAAPVEQAFEMLADVAQGDYTRWTIVYDLTGAEIHFRTHAGPARKHLRLAELDFDCATPVRVIDINTAPAGDIVPHLTDYTVDLNLGLIRSSFSRTEFLSGVPDEALEGLSHYPEDQPCTSP